MLQKITLTCLLAICTQFCMAVTDKSALIIANTNYAESPLKNPANDAKIVGAALSKAGFKTIVVNNVSRDQLFQSVKRFTDSLKADSIALVYYAGHGVQINKNNYLLPIDIKLTNDVGIQSEAYPLDHMVERLNKSKSAVNILVLDACRNNPFQNSDQYRGLSALGLTKTVSPRGMLIAYSTQPGTLARDGSGDNSIYAKAFSNVIKRPGITIEEAFNLVAQVVRVETDDLQQPVIETSIADRFYFLPPPDVAMVPRNYKREVVNIVKDPNDYRAVKPGLQEPKSSQEPRKEIASFGLRWHQEDFFDALVRSDEKIVRLYLKGGMRFRNGGPYDYNLVNLIDQNKQSHKMIKLLIDEKAIDLEDLKKKYSHFSLQSLGLMEDKFGHQEHFITPVSAAIWTSQPELLGLLLKNGASANEYCASRRSDVPIESCTQIVEPRKDTKYFSS